MTVLKEYKNKNIGEFMSIPTKSYENGDVLDALYFSRYMKRLLTSSIEEMRSTEHYKNTMNKWKTALSDVDMNDFNSVESKLKFNINVFDPLKTEMQMQGGRVAKESYKTVELLKVGKDKYKPMVKVTGGGFSQPIEAARNFSEHNDHDHNQHHQQVAQVLARLAYLHKHHEYHDEYHEHKHHNQNNLLNQYMMMLYLKL